MKSLARPLSSLSLALTTSFALSACLEADRPQQKPTAPLTAPTADAGAALNESQVAIILPSEALARYHEQATGLRLTAYAVVNGERGEALAPATLYPLAADGRYLLSSAESARESFEVDAELVDAEQNVLALGTLRGSLAKKGATLLEVALRPFEARPVPLNLFVSLKQPTSSSVYPSPEPSAVRGVLDTACVKCHNKTKSLGGLDLSGFPYLSTKAALGNDMLTITDLVVSRMVKKTMPPRIADADIHARNTEVMKSYLETLKKDKHEAGIAAPAIKSVRLTLLFGGEQQFSALLQPLAEGYQLDSAIALLAAKPYFFDLTVLGTSDQELLALKNVQLLLPADGHVKLAFDLPPPASTPAPSEPAAPSSR